MASLNMAITSLRAMPRAIARFQQASANASINTTMGLPKKLVMGSALSDAGKAQVTAIKITGNKAVAKLLNTPGNFSSGIVLGLNVESGVHSIFFKREENKGPATIIAGIATRMP